MFPFLGPWEWPSDPLLDKYSADGVDNKDDTMETTRLNVMVAIRLGSFHHAVKKTTLKITPMLCHVNRMPVGGIVWGSSHIYCFVFGLLHTQFHMSCACM